MLLLLLPLTNIQIFTRLSFFCTFKMKLSSSSSPYSSLDFNFQYPSCPQIRQFYLFHLMAVGILALYNSQEKLLHQRNARASI